MCIKKWGAEKVLESLLRIFPEADLYTLIYDEKLVWDVFPKNRIHDSCFALRSQKIYNVFKKQRLCLWAMAQSVESLDFSSYDRVIISSSGFAHGLKTAKDTKTLVYYHAPARYMWDWTHEYRKELWFNKGVLGLLYLYFLSKTRIWDYEASQKNNILIANSYTTQKRIQKYYKRDSQVLFPPVETKRFSKKVDKKWTKQDYYIILSALTEFKRLDIAIQAFNKLPENKLIIIGEGDYKESLMKIAEKNIQFVWAKFGSDLVTLVQESLGLIFPGEEDFWIVPIEVMAAGKPVFALYKWWLTETVIKWVTGDFFSDPKGTDFIKSFKSFHKNNTSWKYQSKDCKNQAEKFSEAVFEKKIKKLIK